MFGKSYGRKRKSTLANRLKKAETRLRKKQKTQAMKSRLETIRKQLGKF
jgi:hypothetical protein